jgi:hypothetical protein
MASNQKLSLYIPKYFEPLAEKTIDEDQNSGGIFDQIAFKQKLIDSLTEMRDSLDGRPKVSNDSNLQTIGATVFLTGGIAGAFMSCNIY